MKLKQYPKYKRSGIQWFGDIPDSWHCDPLYSLARLKKNVNCTDRELLSVYLNLGVVRFKDVDEKRTNVTSEDLSKYQAVDPGDFVLNNQQAWRGSVGVSKYKGIVSPAYLVLQLSNVLSPEYANYLFRDRGMVTQYLIASKGVGSIQRNLYWPYLKRSTVIYPSYDEQLTVAKYLNYKERQINQYIRNKRHLINLLNEQKQAIIHNVMTQGLNSRVRLRPSGVDWIGNIPAHWNVKRIKYIFREAEERKEDKDYVLLSFSRYKGLRPHSEIAGRPASATDLSKYKVCKFGNLLMNRMQAWSGMITDVAIEGIVSPDYSVFHAIGDVCVEYFGWLFRTKTYVQQFAIASKGVGDGFNRLYTPDFGAIFAIFPPKDEQEKIVEWVRKNTVKINKDIDCYQVQIDYMKEYHVRLISDVVTGKIDVRDVKLPDLGEESWQESIDEQEISEDIEDNEEVVNADE